MSMSRIEIFEGIGGKGDSRVGYKHEPIDDAMMMAEMDEDLDLLLAHEEEEEGGCDVPDDVLAEMEDAMREERLESRDVEEMDAGPEERTATDAEKEKDKLVGKESIEKEEEGRLSMASCEYVSPSKRLLDLEGDALQVTSCSGELVYCKVYSNEEVESVRLKNVEKTHARRKGSLLGQSIEVMMDKIDMKRTMAALERSERLRNMADNTVDVAEEEGKGSMKASKRSKKDKRDILWVDKYSPKNFLELLSDERINRDVLHWIKNWDQCVFGRLPPKPQNAPAPHMFMRNAKREQKSYVNPCHEIDIDGRPKHKVLLMAGPPGYGKTTLAHILAKHCGYRPYEINASDNRSSSSLQQRVIDAIQMQPLIGDRRPNCIIIDEIDGALGGEGRGGVEALLKIINAGELPNAKTEERPKAEPRRRKGLAGKLQRPIICICNDLYAPALRPLREVAAIVRFKKPNPGRLASRLRRVCDIERVRVEGRALSVLSNSADCDIRSCLNTLQFLFRQGKSVTVADVVALGVGQKDLTRGVFDAWSAIFQASSLASNTYQSFGKASSSAHTVEVISREQQELDRTLSLLQCVGDTELVLSGCYENILRMPYSDLTMKKTCEAIDWMGVSETMIQHVHRTSDYSVMSYAQYGPLAVKKLAACPDRVQLEWPKAYSNFQRVLQSNKSLLVSWLQQVTPQSVPHISPKAAAMDVLSHLQNILSVNFRTVSHNLQSKAEKESIRNLVDVMISYGLSYAETSMEDFSGQRNYLEPAIDRMHRYSNLPTKKRHVTDTQRQIITHELTVERIRRCNQRYGDVFTKGSGDPANNTPVLAHELVVKDEVLQKIRSDTSSRGTWLDEMRNLAVKRTLGIKDGQLEGPAMKRPKIMYKFNEGVTRAVRMTVKFKDLL